MVLVKGVPAKPLNPLLAGAWQCVHGPVALRVGGGLQSWGKLCRGPSPRV